MLTDDRYLFYNNGQFVKGKVYIPYNALKHSHDWVIREIGFIEARGIILTDYPDYIGKTILIHDDIPRSMHYHKNHLALLEVLGYPEKGTEQYNNLIHGLVLGKL